MCRPEFLLMGSIKGDSCAALRLFDDMTKGSSEATEVFNNPSLHGSSDSKYFTIDLVELYVFVIPTVIRENDIHVKDFCYIAKQEKVSQID